MRVQFVLLCFLCAGFLPACETMDGTGGGILGGGGGVGGLPRLTEVNLLTLEQEKALGAEVAAQVEQQERVLQDPQLQAYIDQVGQRVASGVERRDVTYQFKVIDAPDTINAFALPGGYMYLYTGLLRMMENEAELASVMGHEIAHVSMQHHGRAMTRQYGIQFLTDLVLGKNPGGALRIARDFGTGAGMNFFSREQERESDTKGMQYMVRAGYRPEAMITFMQKMMAADQAAGGGGRRLAFLATHPATEARIQALTAQLQQFPPGQRQDLLNEEQYRAQVLNRLR
jgi:beta-barrel assembly-enhancing protease